MSYCNHFISNLNVNLYVIIAYVLEMYTDYYLIIRDPIFYVQAQQRFTGLMTDAMRYLHTMGY